MSQINGYTLDESAVRATTTVDNRWYRLHRHGKTVIAETADEVPFSSRAERELHALREQVAFLRECLEDAEAMNRQRRSERAFRSGARVLSQAKSLRTQLDKFIAMGKTK